MATSGQLNTNTTYESYFWVKWEQVGDQDIAKNQTQIKWTCGVYCGHSFYSNAIKMSAVTINGTQVFGGGTYSNYETGNHTIATDTMWINHNTDGTKTFSIGSFTGWLYSNHNYSSSGGSYSLTTIPRGATITAAPDFTDQDNPITIEYSNPAGDSVESLGMCITFTGAIADVPYRYDVDPNGTTYEFNLSDAALETLRNNTSGSNRKLYFCIQAKIGGTYYRHTYEVAFSIVENDDSKPAIMMTASLDNGSLPSKFGSLCIQGKSRYDVTLSAEGKYGASITNLYATLEGKTYTQSSFKTDVIQGSGIKLVGYAKDSRGFTRDATQEINAIAYSKPLVIPIGSENAIQCYRSDENGNRVGNSTSVWIKAKKSHHDVVGENKCALQWRWKKVSEAWSDTNHQWVDLVSKDATTNEYNALVGVVFDLKEAYTIQVMAIDDIGEYDIKTFEIPTRDVALHLGKGGKNVAIGTYCDYSQERTFYSDWVGIFGKGLLGTSLNNNVTDVLTFAEECIDGLTPIIINESTNKANLPDGNYAYSVGIIHKRAADQYNVVLMDYVTGKIAINVYFGGTWTGWKYLTPQ